MNWAGTGCANNGPGPPRAEGPPQEAAAGIYSYSFIVGLIKISPGSFSASLNRTPGPWPDQP